MPIALRLRLVPPAGVTPTSNTGTSTSGGGGMPAGGGGMPAGGGGMAATPCAVGQTKQCCGDGTCDGPETSSNCAADCKSSAGTTSTSTNPAPATSPVTTTTSQSAYTGICATDGSSYRYAETVSGSTRTIVTNSCPNHPYYVLNPNTPYGKATTYTVPLAPTYTSTKTKDLSQVRERAHHSFERTIG